MTEFLELLLELAKYTKYVKHLKWLWEPNQEARKMSEKQALTDDLEEEFRQVISDIKDAVHEGKTRLFHERTTLDELFVTGEGPQGKITSIPDKFKDHIVVASDGNRSWLVWKQNCSPYFDDRP
ncbi:MAG: hypothetical protein OXG98_11985 [Gemmatimonadetes bacterium]|nr:hypothetical protein [Gemmatimonadota bacterium]